jgi:multiple sugar transport system permease protein
VATLTAPVPLRRRRKLWTESRVGLTMLVPGIVLIVVFMLIPFFYSIWLSLHVEIVGSNIPIRSVGLLFYRHLFSDPIFRGIFLKSLENNGIFALVVVPLQTGLAMFLAILVNRNGAFVKFCRTTFFLPVVFPMVLTSLIWKAILAPGPAGMLNAVLRAVTFGHFTPQYWLGNVHLALPSIILLSVWQGTGFQMVIFLAGLQGIPQSHYEAALIDGASRWNLFRDVTLPGLRNTTIFVVMVTTIFSLQVFDQVYLLTQGGPLNATSSVMYLAVSQAYVANNVGQGAAISVVLSFIILLLSLIQRQVLRERVD